MPGPQADEHWSEASLQVVHGTHGLLNDPHEACRVSGELWVTDQIVPPKVAEGEQVLDGVVLVEDAEEDLFANSGQVLLHVRPGGTDEFPLVYGENSAVVAAVG